MNQSLFHISIPVVELVIRALAIYIFVLLALRIGGKRQLAQMSPTEFVAVLLISNAVQNSMNGGDNSLTGGMILAVVLVVSSTLISYLTFRHRRIGHLIEGTPTLLIHHGKPIEEHIRKERISSYELKGMLRRQGIHSIAEVHSGILEATGELSIIRESEVRKDPSTQSV